MRRRPALALGVTVLLFALADSARADFCVGPSPCLPTLQDAIDAANTSPGTDTITVAAGTFSGGAIALVDNPVNIVGTGPTQTTLTASSGTVLEVADGSSVSSLHISVPNSGPSSAGLRLLNATGADLLVDTPSPVQGQGVVLEGVARLERSTIALGVPPGINGNLGISAQDPGAGTGPVTVTGVTVSAENGVTVTDDVTLALQSSRIIAQEGISTHKGSAVVDDVLFAVLPADSGPAFAAGSGETGDPATTTLRNVTAWGPGAPSEGVRTISPAATIHVVSTAIRNFGTDLANTAGSIDANHSSFGSSTGTIGGGTGNVAADPGFLDAAGGDFRLPFSSPLVDAGDPGPLLGPGVDLAGAPRVVNGRVDIGAFEYQRRPPVPSIAVSQGSPKTGDPVGFDGGGSTDADPGDSPLSFAWAFDDGGTASGASVAHVFSTAGAHTATLTVTDPAGASASLSRTVEIGAQPIDVTLPPVPSLSSFSATNSSFAVKHTAGAAGKKKKPKPKRGTTFRYTLSAAARSTRISVDALLAGKRSGRSCVKPTKKLARAKGCTRIVAKGGISGPAASGRNTFAWDGRLNRKALAPGRYKATARATDRFGRLSNTKTLTFTIVASR